MFQCPIEPGLHLRLLEMKDAEELATLITRNSAHIGKWLPFARGAYSVEDAITFIGRTRRQFGDNLGFQAGIIVEGEIAGVIGIHPIDWENAQSSIGYWVAEEHQGRGIVTRASRAILDYVFGTLGLHRMEIRVQPGHTKSQGVPERLGFTLEGTLRQVMKHPDRFVDHLVYGMLADEWAATSLP